MKKKGYERDLPKRLYGYFLGFCDEGSVPSFTKFAAAVGRTTEQLLEYRTKHKEFDRAWRECCEIRRDYLIDRALCKRYDPSFVKFLLSETFSDEGGGGGDGGLSVEISVIE